MTPGSPWSRFKWGKCEFGLLRDRLNTKKNSATEDHVVGPPLEPASVRSPLISSCTDQRDQPLPAPSLLSTPVKVPLPAERHNTKNVSEQSLTGDLYILLDTCTLTTDTNKIDLNSSTHAASSGLVASPNRIAAIPFARASGKDYFRTTIFFPANFVTLLAVI